MDNLEFLDGSEEPKGEAQPEIVEEAETPQDQESRERDERGRFKAKEEVAEEDVEPTPEITPEPQAEPKPEVPPGMVPVSVLQELREELKSLKAQQPQAQQQPQEPLQVPDPLEDPEGYQRYQDFVRFNDKLDISEEMARDKVGDELVDAATEWGKQQFQTNPAMYADFARQRNPYGYLVKQYQRQQSLTKLGDDPTEIEAFLAWKQAQQALQQPASQPVETQPAPTSSIASAPSAGGAQQVATGPGVAFDEIIK